MRTSVHTCECEAPHSVNGAGGKKNEWAVCEGMVSSHFHGNPRL